MVDEVRSVWLILYHTYMYDFETYMKYANRTTSHTMSIISSQYVIQMLHVFKNDTFVAFDASFTFTFTFMKKQLESKD